MIPEEVRVIALDAAGTILEPRPAVHEAYCQVAQLFGFHLDPQEIKKRFPEAMRTFFPLAWQPEQAQTDHIQQWNAWQGLVTQVLGEIPANQIEPVFHALWEYFRQASHWHVYPDVEPTLKALRQRGYILCVLSNFDQRLYDIASQCPELATIEHWFASVDVGHQKPCASFFRTIEQRLGYASHQFLMVGDSFEADYQGARNAHWHARWLQRDASQQPLQDVATIHTLSEL
jgi:putative hydrolase of the HAD superfamily